MAAGCWRASAESALPPCRAFCMLARSSSNDCSVYSFLLRLRRYNLSLSSSTMSAVGPTVLCARKRTSFDCMTMSLSVRERVPEIAVRVVPDMSAKDIGPMPWIETFCSMVMSAAAKPLASSSRAPRPAAKPQMGLFRFIGASPLFVSLSGMLPSGGACRAFAVGLFEEALADADGQRRHFHQLVIGNEFHRVLQRELDRRSQQDRIVLAGGADVGELLGLDRVHDQVVVAAVDADDHSFVELLPGADEHAPALLQIEQRVGHCLALLVADQHAVVTVGNVALDGRVAVEDVADQAGAAGQRHELALEPDQSARRYAVLQARAAVAIDRHVRELGATGAEGLHDRALVLGIDVDGQRLERLVDLAVDDLRQHLRARYGKLIAFAAHILDQDRQVQLAAAGDSHDIRLVGVLDAQGDVALQLSIQPLAQLAAGDELPLAA